MSTQPHLVSVIETAGVGLRWPVLNIDSVTTTCPTRLIKIHLHSVSPLSLFFLPHFVSFLLGDMQCTRVMFCLCLGVKMQQDVMSRLSSTQKDTTVYLRCTGTQFKHSAWRSEVHKDKTGFLWHYVKSQRPSKEACQYSMCPLRLDFKITDKTVPQMTPRSTHLYTSLHISSFFYSLSLEALLLCQTSPVL